MDMNNFQNNEPLKVESNNSGIKTIIVLVLIIVAIGVVIWLFTGKSFNKDNSNNTTNNNSSSNTNQESSNNSNNSTSGSKVDLNIDPDFDLDGPFLMPISDIFYETGKGTIAVGQISRGSVHVGDSISIMGLDHDIITTTVSEIEHILSSIDEAQAGDKVSIYLTDVAREDIEKGQVLALPNSIEETKNFEAEISFLTTNAGGINLPITSDYPCLIHFNDIDIDGTLLLDNNNINPGDKVTLNIKLERSMALDEDMKFLIKDSDKTIGAGVITNVD